MTLEFKTTAFGRPLYLWVAIFAFMGMMTFVNQSIYGSALMGGILLALLWAEGEFK